MGKLNQGPFQGFIGKTGGLVGKRWKGKYVVSAYQPIVNNPKSGKQLIQRDLFKQAVLAVKTFFSGVVRANLSSGWVGVTLLSSNIGVCVRMLRQKFNIDNGIFVPKGLSIKTGTLSSGLSDFGNSVLDLLKIVQTGTTSSCALSWDVLPGVRYFGSDIALTSINGSLTVVWETLAPNLKISSLDLVLDDQDVNVSLEKAYGLLETAEECGNWNFVYKIATGELAENAVCVTEALRTNEGVINQAFFNVGFYVPDGVVFNSKFITKNIKVV